jgi:UDP-3-O-[3-hydroxymyristoyl] glucosamine N-acyltransferase
MTQAFSLGEIAQHVQGKLVGNSDLMITKMNTLASATGGQLSFLSNSKYKADLANSKAGAVILNQANASAFEGNVIICDDPYVAFARASQLLDSTPSLDDGISDAANIHPDATIGESAKIAAGAVIESGAVIGNRVSIGANSFVGKNAVLGDDVNLRANVSIYHSVQLADGVSVHSGTVIGSDGFGYANDKGQWVKIPQTGSVVVGKNTEIGANTCIDRGALDDTVIGANVIIDNLVQIAHNVSIGDGSCICGGTGIAGSTNIGKYVVLAGTVVVNGHIDICDKVQVTGFSMVTKNITEPGVYSSGMPALPTRDWQRNTVRLRQIDKLYDRVKALEAFNANKS